MIAQSWFSNGKLLITGEYLVMEGAKALALPVNVGQYLSAKQVKGNQLTWTALKPDGIWFQTKFGLPGLEVIHSTHPDLGNRLKDILKITRNLNANFLANEIGTEVETVLEFDPEFGLGSSSTFIANLAGWAGVDPFELQIRTFGGSGYDIACANSKTPVLFQLIEKKPVIDSANFNPSFKDQVYFVYLGNKKRSDESIRSFRKNASYQSSDIDFISSLTESIIQAATLSEFESLIEIHETKMSEILKMPTVRYQRFPDHIGAVTSLGAWGGDFVLMTSTMEESDFKNYIKEKGYNVIYNYEELILS